MFLDQQIYLPPQSNLLELFYFPSILSQLSPDAVINLRAFAVALLQELDMDEFVHDTGAPKGLLQSLEAETFEINTLSGGQLKKIAIIQAILNKPPEDVPYIIIMDESFTGLDTRSIAKVKSALQAHLPHATLLAVDHQAALNNVDHFYDAEIHFTRDFGATLHYFNAEQDARRAYDREDAGDATQPWEVLFNEETGGFVYASNDTTD